MRKLKLLDVLVAIGGKSPINRRIKVYIPTRYKLISDNAELIEWLTADIFGKSFLRWFYSAWDYVMIGDGRMVKETVTRLKWCGWEQDRDYTIVKVFSKTILAEEKIARII